LTEPIVEFLSATGTLPTSSDYIGFYRADAGGLQFVLANDNAGGTAVADSETLLSAAATTALTGQHKIGFRVNADDSVEVYIDGEKVKVNSSGAALAITATALPIESLTQKYATTRGATGDLATVALLIDWVATLVKPA
jgi:hypothetical protein